MTTSAKVFGPALQSLFNAEIAWTSNTIKAALCTSAYSPDQDAHRYMTDIAHELTGGGYARVTLTTKTAVYTGGTNTLALGCDDVLFPALTATAVRYALFFKDSGSDATSPLVCWMDFGADSAPTATDLTVVMPAGGLVQFTAA